MLTARMRSGAVCVVSISQTASTALIDHIDLMDLARPVNADIPTEYLTHHRTSVHTGRRSLDLPLYYRTAGSTRRVGSRQQAQDIQSTRDCYVIAETTGAARRRPLDLRQTLDITG